MRKYILYAMLLWSHFLGSQILTCSENWSLPMKAPVELSSGYGDLRPNHFHMGLDIRTFGKENLPIYAIQEGYISRLRVSSVGYGWVLYVSHPNGYTSVYAHCNKFAPAIQQFYLDTSEVLQSNELDLILAPGRLTVQKGELIALSGNTGGSNAPHLHFELRDTKTEHALNPLLHGFFVSDSGQPILSGIRIYAIDTNGFEVPQKSYNVTLSGAQHKASLPNGFLAEGERIGIAIQVEDYFTKAGRSFGLFSAEVWASTGGHFAFELDDLDFNDARYINTHHDFAYAQTSKKKFQKIFKSPVNPLTIYPYDGAGAFELQANDSVQFSLMLRDVNGNETQHQLWVKYPGQKGPAKSHYSAQTHWMPAEKYTYEAGPWKLQLDSFTFFEPVRKSIDLTKNNIGSSRVQLAKAFKLHYALSDTANVRQYCLTMNGSALFTTYKDGYLSADSKNLGTYGVRKDNTAPTIQAQPAKQLDSLNKGAWSWIVRDDLSGISSYSCWQNSKWVPAYYDAKNSLIKAQFNIPFTPGTTIEIRVTDAAGNERVLQSSTPLAPFK
ncbi:MAG: M23 family metallopeptidase [Flavobacteriales bacterium]